LRVRDLPTRFGKLFADRVEFGLKLRAFLHEFGNLRVQTGRRFFVFE
jgi:hypothetical protein